MTTFEGFDAPWSVLSDLVDNLVVGPLLLGAAYIASGHVKP